MVYMWSASRTKQLHSLTRMFNTAASWALSSMTWHQMMTRYIRDLPVTATYLNNDLPLFEYSMPRLPLCTTQVKNNAGLLFSVPVNTHYTAVTFQPSLKNLSSYAPFPEAGFPHKNLIGCKVTSTSTSAHLKSHQLSILLIQSLTKYNMHRQLLLSVYYTYDHVYRTSLFLLLISVKHLLLMIS